MTNRNGMTNQEFTRQKTPKTKCISNEDDLNMQEEEWWEKKTILKDQSEVKWSVSMQGWQF